MIKKTNGKVNELANENKDPVPVKAGSRPKVKSGNSAKPKEVANNYGELGPKNEGTEQEIKDQTGNAGQGVVVDEKVASRTELAPIAERKPLPSKPMNQVQSIDRMDSVEKADQMMGENVGRAGSAEDYEVGVKVDGTVDRKVASKKGTRKKVNMEPSSLIVGKVSPRKLEIEKREVMEQLVQKCQPTSEPGKKPASNKEPFIQMEPEAELSKSAAKDCAEKVQALIGEIPPDGAVEGGENSTGRYRQLQAPLLNNLYIYILNRMVDQGPKFASKVSELVASYLNDGIADKNGILDESLIYESIDNDPFPREADLELLLKDIMLQMNLKETNGLFSQIKRKYLTFKECEKLAKKAMGDAREELKNEIKINAVGDKHVIKDVFGISNDLLDKFVESRLIRKKNWGGKNYYKLIEVKNAINGRANLDFSKGNSDSSK